jgi:hypothetical protein
MRKKTNPVHYVDNKKFYSEIVKHHEAVANARAENREEPRINDYIGSCIYKIANNLALNSNFIRYSFKEEFIEDAIENCFMYFNGFDHTKWQNPFAYFTQISYNAFIRRIKKEARARYTKYKFFQEMIVTTDSSLMVDGDDKPVVNPQMTDYMNTFITNFEQKERENKLKQKEKSLQNKENKKKTIQDFYEGKGKEDGNGKPEFASTGGEYDQRNAECP